MSTSAEATVKIKVISLGQWGDNYTAGEIREEARDEAKRKLTNLFSKNTADFEIVGEPEITMIIAKEA